MTTTITPEQADTLPAEAIDLDALAQALRNTSGWLAALDYPGVGTAMATCKRAADALGSLARRAAVPSEQEPVAYRWRPAGVTFGDVWSVGVTPPHERSGWTVESLYTRPAPAARVKVKPLKWYREVAIGASTSEEWFATTPEGQSLTVTYDESCELPWVAHPFPPGPSNYATADEAKAALEAAREARIRRALDTGEPK